jgi:hypothetical protein
MATGFHHPVFLHSRQMLGNLSLRPTKNFLKVANAEGPLRKKVQNAKARFVTEALVYLN